MTNPNEPAFGHGDIDHCCGLTKREYFAAMAMQGLIQNPDPCFIKGPCTEYLAAGALKIADALIAELNKEAKP